MKTRSQQCALALMVVLLIPASAFAQNAQNEIGLWLSTANFQSTNLSDEEIDFEIAFESEAGAALSYSRHWNEHFATEFAVQRLTADTQANLGDISIKLGEIELTALTGIAQWHFMPSSRIVPYVGGGVAYVQGQLDIDEEFEDPELGSVDVDFEPQATLVINGGVSFPFAHGFSLALDAKWFPYEAQAEDDPADPGIDLDPFVLSAGARFRF